MLNFKLILLGSIFIFSLCFILLVLSYTLAEDLPDSEKLSPYECGFSPFSDNRIEFDVKFFFSRHFIYYLWFGVIFFISVKFDFEYNKLFRYYIYDYLYFHINNWFNLRMIKRRTWLILKRCYLKLNVQLIEE